MQRSIREIGSEFWIDEEPQKFIKEHDGVFALSGRTAIDLIMQDILKKKPVKKVYMPAWCCGSMVAPFLTHKIEASFYDVSLTDDLRIECHTGITESTDILYVTNYFGYENTLPVEIINHFKAKGTIILYDRTHSFLMDDDPYLEVADYSFASIRKWMGVVDGAEVNGLTEKPTLKDCPYAFIKEKAMRQKWQYLQGDNSIVKENVLMAFGDFGHRLAEDYIDYEMDPLSYALYKQEDLKAMTAKRKENAAYLHEHLKGVKFLGGLTNNTAPIFVPVFFENKEKRDTVRKTLIEKQIYCPIHWPKPQQIPAEFAVNALMDTELSLICDQRYDLNDMECIVTQISQIIQK